jgi:hypothetical protein
VRRTQLYLDDDLWNTLHDHARREGTTISDLARKALRDRYCVDRERRRKAMLAFVGIRADRADIGDSTEYIRKLRSTDSARMERLK